MRSKVAITLLMLPVTPTGNWTIYGGTVLVKDPKRGTSLSLTILVGSMGREAASGTVQRLYAFTQTSA
jgi:hypothetical protein